MGKTVGKVLKIGGAIAMGVATFNPGITATLLAGTASLTVGLGTLGTVAFLGGSVLDPPSLSNSLADQGVKLGLVQSSIMPRQVLYGKAATAGTLLYRDTTGANNENLHMVIGLAGHEIDSFDSWTFGGESSGGWSTNITVNQHLGTDAQAADSALVAASTKWTTDHKLSGIAYAYVKLVWDAEKFPNGLENLLFTLNGRKVYDPRKDSTNGGTGTHRLDDATTWEWSENPILCAADYLRGVYVGGQLIAGMGVEDGAGEVTEAAIDAKSRINWSEVAAEATICDELVSLKAGGTEKRYTCNGWVDPNRTHRENMSGLMSSCGGSVMFINGQWTFRVASARVASHTRQGEDVGGSISMRAKRSVSSRVNGVKGLYADPNIDYQLNEYAPRQSAIYLTQDGGQEHWLQLDLPYTKSATMAQRLSNIALKGSRLEKLVTTRMTPVSLENQALDTIYFNHPEFNLVNQKMKIIDYQSVPSTDKSGNPLFLIEQQLIEEDDTIYSWTPATDEITVATPNTVDKANTKAIDLGGLAGSVDFALQVSGTEKPANNADVTGANTALNTNNVGTQTATFVDEKTTNLLGNSIRSFLSSLNTVGWHRCFKVTSGGRGAWRITFGATGGGTTAGYTVIEASSHYAGGARMTVVQGGAHDTFTQCRFRYDSATSTLYFDVYKNDTASTTLLYSVEAMYGAGTVSAVDTPNIGSPVGEVDTCVAKVGYLVGFSVNRQNATADDDFQVDLDGNHYIRGKQTMNNSAQLEADTKPSIDYFGLTSGVKLDQGDGFQRSVAFGLAEGVVRDGDVITFGTAWDSSNLPQVSFGVGGLAYDNSGTLVGDQIQSFKATGLSPSGFTAELKLQEATASPFSVVDTGAVETSADVWELHKSVAAEAWNDEYKIRYDITVWSIGYEPGIGYISGHMTVGFYVNDGLGYVQRATQTFYSSGLNSSYLNQTKTVTVDGVGQIAGYEFKILIESRGSTSSTIDNLDSVSYETAALPTKMSATPTGVSPVPYSVGGGKDAI